MAYEPRLLCHMGRFYWGWGGLQFVDMGPLSHPRGATGLPLHSLQQLTKLRGMMTCFSNLARSLQVEPRSLHTQSLEAPGQSSNCYGTLLQPAATIADKITAFIFSNTRGFQGRGAPIITLQQFIPSRILCCSNVSCNNY